jgi:hypothetical protein
MFFETAIINLLILIILNYQVFVHDERFYLMMLQDIGKPKS